MRGIPGTVGGALRMNAGAYGRELADVFDMARAIDREGREHVLHAGDMGFSYRHTDVPEDIIFVSAVLAGVPAEPATVKARMAEIGADAALSQERKSAE